MATRRGSGAAGGGSQVRRDVDNTRTLLLNTAVALFEKYGYDATSVQHIVDAAGRTKGAFYYYFQTKEDLLHSIHDKFIDFQLDRARAVLARDAPLDELLAQMVTEVLMEPLGIYKSEISIFLQEQRFLSEKSFGEIRQKRDEFENAVVDLVQRGIDAGVFKDVGPARITAFGIIGMCAWSYTWLEVGGEGRLTPRQIGEQFGRMVVDGLRA
ncbi:TetR/AcrR family transcriptional regulator [Saccharopolyspora sp. NPDC050642]|uniref:TetR/AcrR family transcriptional regulator n=1 Tax=Saccharopolyspora sp. NPDC050642 TaxID=3157099 RepID=UPI0033F4BD8E